MKRHTQKLICILGVFAGLSLAAIPLKASAVICYGTDPCTASTGFNAHVAEILTVSLDLPDNWAFGKTGDFLRNGVTLSVASNNGNGFTANMVSKNTTSLVNKDKSTATIPTLAADTTRANFPTNHWGYSLDDTAEGDINSIYKALVEPGGTPINIITSSSAASMTKDIYFGAKADASTVSGTYVGTVVFNVVSTVIPPTISRLTYLQDFASLSSTDKTSVADSMIQNRAYELKDSRDEQTYKITKLSDGTIWMTQNLNIAGGTELTPDTSNVSANYTLPASSTSGFNDNSTAYVYNDSTYGGYYSYVAVTAGTNPSDGNATSDICPKGWRLPTVDEYSALRSTYTTGDTLTASPWNGVYGGYYDDSSNNNIGSFGAYWSSTASFSLYFDNSQHAGVSGNSKKGGLSARCISQ